MKLATVLLMMFACGVPMSAQSTDVTLWLSSQRNEEGGRISATDAEDVRFDDGSGFGVSASRMFGSRISGELSVFRTFSGAEIRVGSATLADLGDVTLTPITAMVRVHFLRRGMVDAYAGGGVAHVRVADLSSADLRAAGLGPVSMDNQTTYALGAGLAVTLTPRLGVVLDARYIPLELSGRLAGQESIEIDMDPLLLSAGLRIRF